jgi:hypothetical protein
VIRQNVERHVVRLVDEQPHLLVDLKGHRIGVVRLRRDIAAQEHLPLLLAERSWTDGVRHAELGHHLTRDLAGSFDVVGRSGRDVVRDDLFGDASAHQHGELIADLFASHQETVPLWKRERVSEGPATRDDRDLVHLVGVRQNMGDEGVTAFVIRDDATFIGVHDPTLALGAGHDAIDGFLDLAQRDGLLRPARREQRGLVDDVGQVRAGKPGRAARKNIELDITSERLSAGVHLQDCLSALQIRTVDDDLPIEATRAKERGIEDVRPVRRRHQDHGRALIEPIHLGQQLVEGLLALVVAAADAGPPLPPDGVDLVDEDDGRSGRFRLLEQVSDPGSAHTDEHLHEVGAADREERNAGLARDGPRQERLAGPRRAEQQHAARDLRAHGLELARMLKVVLHLLQFLDRLFKAGDVRERRLRLILGDGLVPASPELHDASTGALRAAHDPQERSDDERRREQNLQQRPDGIRSRGLDVERNAKPRHLLRQLVGRLRRIGDAIPRSIVEFAGDDLIALEQLRPLDATLRQRLLKLAVRKLGRRCRPRHEGHEAEQEHEAEDDPHGGRADDLLDRWLRPRQSRLLDGRSDA